MTCNDPEGSSQEQRILEVEASSETEGYLLAVARGFLA